MAEAEEVSRSGRVRKKSSKLLSIEKESLDEQQLAFQIAARSKAKTVASTHKKAAAKVVTPPQQPQKTTKVVPKLRIKLGSVPSISVRKDSTTSSKKEHKKKERSVSTKKEPFGPVKKEPSASVKKEPSASVKKEPPASENKAPIHKPDLGDTPFKQLLTIARSKKAPKKATPKIDKTKSVPSPSSSKSRKATAKKKKTTLKVVSMQQEAESVVATNPSLSLHMLDNSSSHEDADYEDSVNEPNDLEIDVGYSPGSAGSDGYNISGEIDEKPGLADKDTTENEAKDVVPEASVSGVGKRQRKPPAKLKEDYVDFDRPANKAAKFFETKKAESRAANAIAKRKATDSGQKKKRNRMPTAYTMWCNSYRAKLQVQSPGMDFATMNRKLGEVWGCITAAEKNLWQRKAKRLATHGISKKNLGSLKYLGSKSIAAVSNKHPPEPATHNVVKKLKAPPVCKITQTEPLDVAAYLDLISESMTTMGNALKLKGGAGETVDPSAALDKLLDTFLCGTSALMCLTQQVVELDGDTDPATHRKRMDDISYYIPDELDPL